MLSMCSPQGVRLSGTTSDGKGQQYRTPAHVISSCGSDIIIVGRGIYEVVKYKQLYRRNISTTLYDLQNPDPVASAIQYRSEGYEAYLQRVKHL